MKSGHIAIDLGAGSGRTILGILEGEPQRVELVELHRFEHEGLPTPTGPVWNLVEIWSNILVGLRAAADYCQNGGIQLESVGVDTWGVDWALLGPSGELLSLPHCYLDAQNEEACKQVLERIGGFDRLYGRCGIQLMSLNTIFQLYARFQNEPKLIEAAEHLVFLPDLFHYWLSGSIAVERSIASTSSMLDANSGDWDLELLQELNFPTHIFGKIEEPGTTLGTLRTEVATRTGLSENLKVVLPSSHDTGSAVAAIPAEGDSWMYLSSGTWSLLGVERRQPELSQRSLEGQFTNERGYDGCVRYLKNIMGLWFVHELRREYQQAADDEVSFSELVDEAASTEAFRTLIDPTDSEFTLTGEMSAKIKRFAELTGQPAPRSRGEEVRCCLESLALCYRATIEGLEANLGQTFDRLHIVGGGSQNMLLNQFVADATQKQVLCGPTECSALGSVLVQACVPGQQAMIREIVRRSFDIQQVPQGAVGDWDAAYQRFQDFGR